MKSVLYARVSTEEQKNNQTIDTQIHGIGGMLQYAANHNLPVPDESMIFIDDGFSGATLIRPALTAFREYLKTHDDVSYFLVYDADRIGRDTYNQLIILEELKKKNITIHFKTGELGTTPNDKLLFTILSAFSEFERAKIMERTQRGMKRRIESGKFNGGRPMFGYKYDYTRGKHELDEAEVKVVKMIYDWYTEDKLNIRQIQAKLFELKIPTKYDALKNTEKNRKMKGLKKYPLGWWSEVTIRNVLANEAYTGKWSCCKRKTLKLDVANPRTGKPKVRQITRDKEEWHPIEIPRIVSDEQYKKALLQARKNLMFAKRCTKQTYLLQGLLRCAKDGLRYRGHQEKSGVIYYYCKSRATNTPQPNCNSPYLRADEIEPIVWNTVKSILENPEEVFTAFRDESILNEERVKSIEGRLDYISSAIKKLEVAKKRITEAFKAEAMTLQEYRKEKTDLELSEEKLMTERDGLSTKLNVQHDVGAKIDLFKETCHKFLSKINDPKIVTERVKKDIIKLVIDEVVIDGEHVKIFATIPLPQKIHERELDKTDTPGTFNSGATLGPVNETNMARIWNKHKTNTPLKGKVFVALSGGVDSSVAVLLLQREGYEVSAGFIRGYNVDGCQDRDLEDARSVAQKINVPFYVFDFEEEYKKRVVDYLLDGYRNGTTPNPDVMCNREIKFGLLYDEAMRLGFSWVASGHYAKIKRAHAGKFVGVYASRDMEKDQTYFLWDVPRDRFEHVLFPLGALKKTQVRAIARDAQLPTADKKDSQGVCFLGKFKFDEFLKEHIITTPGVIYDASGKKVGTHDGAALYTIGQKHGFINTAGRSYTVVEKNLLKNTLTVVYDDDPRLYTKEIVLMHENIIDTKTEQKLAAGKSVPVWVRTRYRQPLAPARVARNGGKTLRLTFRHPEKVFPASGQSAVWYSRWGKMLGGGVIL